MREAYEEWLDMGKPGRLVYTILRFQGGLDEKELLASVAATLRYGGELIDPSSHRKVVGFSCELSSSDSWDMHLDSIEEFCEENMHALRYASDRGLSMQIDTAVDQLSTTPRRLHSEVTYPPTLLSVLGRLGISVAVTVYPVDEADSAG